MNKIKRVHIIAVGGAVMHNMAIALKLKGCAVTGSDDAIFNPSKSNLEKHGLLPKKEGWDATLIDSSIDAVIVGMHARPDNPELAKAKELGIPCYSFPEFMYQQSTDCTRLVVAGSHGKTTITSMLLHAYKKLNKPFNYLVGSKIEGFDCMVGFDDRADVAIFEGDEYLSSPLDDRSKFLHYKPHAVIITGLAWDHINFFPTYQKYLHTFEMLIRDIVPGGALIYFEGDKDLVDLVAKNPNPNIRYIPYNALNNREIDDHSMVLSQCIGQVELPFFGAHNLANSESARLIFSEIGINGSSFYNSLKDYQGAARRLQKVHDENETTIFYDFAHAPSKVTATVKAVRNKYPDRKFIAILELYTFSSINPEFIPFYKGSLSPANEATVFFDPKVLEHKKMPPMEVKQVEEAFNNPDIMVKNNKEEVYTYLKGLDLENSVLLLMSSGTLFEEYLKAFQD